MLWVVRRASQAVRRKGTTKETLYSVSTLRRSMGAPRLLQADGTGVDVVRTSGVMRLLPREASHDE